MCCAGPVDSEIWNKSMKSEQPLEGDTKSGDWSRYADSSYGAAMASTREFVLSELDAKDFSLPCEAMAGTVYQVTRMKIYHKRVNPWTASDGSMAVNACIQVAVYAWLSGIDLRLRKTLLSAPCRRWH